MPQEIRSATFGTRVNFVLPATSASWTRAAVRFDDRIHQSGGSLVKEYGPAAFFYAFVNVCTVADVCASCLSTRIWCQGAKTLRHQERLSRSGGTSLRRSARSGCAACPCP